MALKLARNLWLLSEKQRQDSKSQEPGQKEMTSKSILILDS